MAKSENNSSRKVAAAFCLLAVLLLQAPFARAAWFASSMACCMTDHCPVPGHHHQSAPAKSEMPMDCGHDMGKKSDCRMSCCTTTDETAINISAFVLTQVEFTLAPLDLTSQLSPLVPQMISRTEKPLSPPPKYLSS